MSIDKTWTTIENRNSDEFSRGLESFVERSKAHVDSRGLIRCPCRKCVNSDFVKVSLMKAHIERFGFSRRYITWVYHGESITPPIVADVALETRWLALSTTLWGKTIPTMITGTRIRREHAALQSCPVCNESRWVDKNTKGKKVAHKVLRYFPLTPRLRRLYCSRHTTKNMIWHSTGRSPEGTMRHPVDGSSWKEFDMKYPNFSREPQNVRLGLAADGFNPYGNMSSAHSTWPVVLTTYNLPPWLCMKESSFMLSLVIPGPKSPGKDMDVFLRPLVEELKQLWHSGVRTKDALTNKFFNMKAVLLWTINDFPARSSLSGWSGQGYKACSTCNKETSSCRVTNKIAYVGHRRFLDPNDPWRTSLEFNGQHETGAAPRQFSNEEIKAQLDRLPTLIPGKHPDFGGVKRKREAFELNWTKRSIFFELEYWSSLQLKHNLDVMHIEKNVCDSLLGTLLMNDKSKDASNARLDLENLKIRKHLWLQKRGNKFFKPQAKYSFTEVDRKHFCQFIKNVKLPDGFGSNISKKVTDNDTNISGLKSHDCYILMQRLIPIGVRGFLAKDKYTPIVELFLHLPDEAICGGPVNMRWMYPFERYMKKLKCYVRNKARPVGSIAEGYVAEEALTFCSMYLQDVQTKFNRPERNEDIIVEKTKMWVFESKCRPASATQVKHLDVYEMQTQNSPLFHKELSALSMGARANASTYSACIVNGVRFMVVSRDTQRTTQNSGVLVEGENGEKYYGQLEEIIELHYAYGYSTVLFRCKWFDTRRGVICENNITSIDTRCEWDKEDQLIFATQAKQVFYIREPSRGNQINNHRWVVENVNHRQIWDLPVNEDPVEDVDNASIENVDVVHSNCSSNCRLVIDFHQYFENLQPTGKVENALVRELAQETQLLATLSNPTPVDESAVFERVLGSRRGHIKGIGHKPSSRTSSSAYSEGQSSYTSPHTRVQPELEAILSNPAFTARIIEIVRSLTPQNDNGSENEGNDDNNGDE
ncbi:hypothetical protein OSB04_003052 [Centaurea solstitialis]|uniref:Transposase n=1 Tax=Centaurea solstitialis TaxID=347529 RepID=A0AA38U4K7_9ASTR|nr:hypothetical protein OSB04_003052 [Centaurea solstitialis]